MKSTLLAFLLTPCLLWAADTTAPDVDNSLIQPPNTEASISIAPKEEPQVIQPQEADPWGLDRFEKKFKIRKTLEEPEFIGGAVVSESTPITPGSSTDSATGTTITNPETTPGTAIDAPAEGTDAAATGDDAVILVTPPPSTMPKETTDETTGDTADADTNETAEDDITAETAATETTNETAVTTEAAATDLPRGRYIKLKTPYHTVFNTYMSGSQNAQYGVLIIPDVWGADDYIKLWTHRFASLGFLAVTIDLYDGRKVQNAQHGARIMRSIDKEWIKTNLKAVLKHMKTVKRKIIIMGWGDSIQYASELAAEDADIMLALIAYHKNATDVRLTDISELPVLKVTNPQLDEHHQDYLNNKNEVQAWNITKSFLKQSLGL